jgi:hypothetical protein
LAVITTFSHGQNYFFDKIKLRQHPTTASTIFDDQPKDNQSTASTEMERSSARPTSRPNSTSHDKMFESVIKFKDSSFNDSQSLGSSRNASNFKHGAITGESNKTLVNNQDNRLGDETSNMEKHGLDENLQITLLNSSFERVKTVSNIDEKHLAGILGILDSMDGRTPLLSEKTDSNYSSTVTNIDLNTSDSNEGYEISYPNPDEVINKLSRELEKHIQREKGVLKVPYWEKTKHRIRFPKLYHTHGTLSLPYDGIVEPFEAWYAGEYHMSRIDYYYGKSVG